MSFTSRTKSTRDDWQTPIHLVASLGTFDLDPCANCLAPNRLAKAGYTKKDNGLTLPWHGRIWLNPPYGKEARKWLFRLSEHGNGIALIPPRVGAKWFHQIVLETCDAIFFYKGRISFVDPFTGKPVKGNNADSILVAYGQNNVDAISSSNLMGKIWRCK